MFSLKEEDLPLAPKKELQETQKTRAEASLTPWKLEKNMKLTSWMQLQEGTASQKSGGFPSLLKTRNLTNT